MGSSMIQICSVFVQFPRIRVGKFVSNIRLCLLFFNEINMGMQEIQHLFQSHPLLLGSFTLKKKNCLLVISNVGKKCLCRFILENPEELKNWKHGTRITPLPDTGEAIRSRQQKIRFLGSLLGSQCYSWLKEQGAADPALVLSTIVPCSENTFLRRYVNHHPEAMEVWQNLKREIGLNSFTSRAR
ncbi:hypothetical protein SDJN02_03210, partial [Cucurbita argyrosperma subsp. argyrosperma]